jgi:hypothetical protein
MDAKTIAIGLVVVAAFSLLRIFSQWRGLSRNKRRIDWDEHFISGLRKAGVNTFEDHDVDFFFTMPDRAACEQLGSVLRPEGYTLDITQDAESGRYSLHASRRMRLIVSDMQALTARFTQLAVDLGGQYDNWAVVGR